MAWLKIETAVARNRKFMKAGPAPAWLWICGLAYCQEGLTNGFIPHEAIDFLGVKNARNMAVRLVGAGLWEAVDGGWQIHDYLAHNKSADEIRRTTKLRAEGGKEGGRPSKKNLTENLLGNLQGSDKETLEGNHPENPALTATATASNRTASNQPADRALAVDGEWARFLKAYPPEGRYDSRMASELFLEARRSGVRLEDMLAALENHKASERWAVAGKIPNVEKWLAEKRWDSSLPPPKVVGVSSRTAGNLAAAQRFLDRRRGE